MERTVEKTIVSLAVGVSVVISGCSISLQTCETSDDCRRLGGGLCTCEDGYCFRFGCLAPTEDAPPADGGDAPATSCPPNAPARPGDSCCPADLVDRSADPDCGQLSASGLLIGPSLPAARSSDGVVAIVHAGETGPARLSFFAPDLVLLGASIDLKHPLEDLAAPVFTPWGELALAGPDGLHLLRPGDSALPAPVGGTSDAAPVAPIPLADGQLLFATRHGELRRTTSGGAHAVLTLTATATSLSLRTDEVLAAAVAGGALVVGDLTAGTVVHEQAGPFVGSPAWGSSEAVYAVRSTGLVGGAALQQGEWISLIGYPIGPQPFSPAVGTGQITLVASASEKRLTAVRWLGTSPTLAWEVTDLPDVPITPPTLGPAGRVYVGLANGALAAIDPPGVLAWTFTVSGRPSGAPLLFDDGAVLHVVGDRLSRIAGLPRPALPWPRLRGNAASTGRQP